MSNLLYLNKRSRDIHLATMACDRDLIYIYCPDLDVDAVMTQEAASLFEASIPNGVRVSQVLVDSATALTLAETVLTTHDILNLPAWRRALVP